MYTERKLNGYIAHLRTEYKDGISKIRSGEAVETADLIKDLYFLLIDIQVAETELKSIVK